MLNAVYEASPLCFKGCLKLEVSGGQTTNSAVAMRAVTCFRGNITLMARCKLYGMMRCALRYLLRGLGSQVTLQVESKSSCGICMSIGIPIKLLGA
jgi:hypothetical protein